MRAHHADPQADLLGAEAVQPSAGIQQSAKLYGPGYTAIWKSLYDMFDLDFESSLDLSQPDEFWRRYLYFNAGYFYYESPHQFGTRFTDYAVKIRDNGPEAIRCQSLDPWLGSDCFAACGA